MEAARKPREAERKQTEALRLLRLAATTMHAPMGRVLRPGGAS